MVEGEVAVERRRKPRDVESGQVRLERVAAPRRRDGAQHRRLMQLSPHPLDGPEEKGELLQGQRRGAKAAAALAAGDGGGEVARGNTPRAAGRQGNEGRTSRGRFLSGGRPLPTRLRRAAPVHLLPDAVGQETAAVLPGDGWAGSICHGITCKRLQKARSSSWLRVYHGGAVTRHCSRGKLHRAGESGGPGSG
jgi:hypothetical protein